MHTCVCVYPASKHHVGDDNIQVACYVQILGIIKLETNGHAGLIDFITRVLLNLWVGYLTDSIESRF